MSINITAYYLTRTRKKYPRRNFIENQRRTAENESSISNKWEIHQGQNGQRDRIKHNIWTGKENLAFKFSEYESSV